VLITKVLNNLKHEKYIDFCDFDLIFVCSVYKFITSALKLQ